MKICIFSLTLFFLATGCSSPKNRLPVPGAVHKSLVSLYPKAEEVKWDKEGANYEASFELDDVEMSVILDAAGNVLETETEMEPNDLPAAVRTSLGKDFAGYSIEEAAIISKNGKTTFEAEVKRDENKLDAIYSASGQLLEKIAKPAKQDESEEGQTENEKNDAAESESDWQKHFDVDKSSLSSTGENEFFILKPGYQLTLNGEENGRKSMLIVTVLNETSVVDGVETRVVEERETQDGALVEVSRNYYALDPDKKDVYYFGEAVDIYKNGKIVGHEGSWESGKNGAHFGLMVPGRPKIGKRYYQELAPELAMDRAEIKSVSDTLTTPAGRFENCLRVEETTPLEPGAKEYKVYAPGVGLILDGTLKITQYASIK